jgi:hypothetical protein
VKQAKVPLVLRDKPYDSDFQHKKPRMFTIFLTKLHHPGGTPNLSMEPFLTVNADLQADQQISALTILVHLKLLRGIALTPDNL